MEDLAPITPSRLRQFGLILGALTAAVFGALVPLLGAGTWPWWPWLAAAVLALLALAAPASLQPVYRAWMRIGAVLGWINTRVLLFCIYALLIVPFGLIMRVLGHDPMRRKLDDKSTSYRVPSRDPHPRHMDKPY